MRGRALPVVLAIALSCAFAATLGGCASARNALGPHVSACFRVLPEARKAVGTRASFAGVVYQPAGSLVTAVQRARAHDIDIPDALADIVRIPTCLVGYKGHFTKQSVKNGWAPLKGPYKFAVVVADQRSGDVLGTVLFHRVPFSFAHYLDFAP